MRNMTTTEFESLTKGQAVRVIETGKIYVLTLILEAQAERAAPFGGTYPASPRRARFEQWRTDRKAFFGPRRSLKAEAVERASEFDR